MAEQAYDKIEKPYAVPYYYLRGANGPGPARTLDEQQGAYDIAHHMRTSDGVTAEASGWTYDAGYNRWGIAATPVATKDITITMPAEIPTGTKVQFRVEAPVFTAGSLLLRYNGSTIKTWAVTDLHDGLLKYNYTTLAAVTTLVLRVPASAAVAVQVKSVSVRVGVQAVPDWLEANGGALDEPAIVPDVVGEANTDAETAIEGEGLVYAEGTAVNDDVVAVDDVISQDPVAGEEARLGSTVTVVLSLGPEE